MIYRRTESSIPLRKSNLENLEMICDHLVLEHKLDERTFRVFSEMLKPSGFRIRMIWTLSDQEKIYSRSVQVWVVSSHTLKL